jgi:hypothetical protein
MGDNPMQFQLKGAAPHFDLAETEETFPIWKLQWEAFLDTSGLNNLTEGDGNAQSKAERRARITALTKSALVGALSKETLLAVSNTPGAMTSAATIITAIENRIAGSTNQIVRAYELFTRHRSPGEDIDTFATTVKDRAGKCGYPADAVDRLTRDAFAITVADDAMLQKVLQLPATATFQDAVTAAKAVFEARKHAATLSGHPVVARMMSQKKDGRRNGGGPSCDNCGRPGHTAGNDKCPAGGKKCNNCNQVGHFAAKCRSAKSKQRSSGRAKKMADSSSDEEEGGDTNTIRLFHLLSKEIPYLAKMQHGSADDRPEPLRKLQGVVVRTAATRDQTRKRVADITYLPDTGANMTVITPAALAAMGVSKYEIRGRNGALKAPAQADGEAGRLRPLGFLRGTLTFGDLSHEEDIFVMKGLQKPLLSKWACLGLGIYESKVLAGGDRAQRQREQMKLQATEAGDARDKARAERVLYKAKENKRCGYYYSSCCATMVPLTWHPAPPPACTGQAVSEDKRQEAYAALAARFPQPLDGVCRVMAGGKVSIKVHPGAEFKSVYHTRPVPIPLQAAFKREIEVMLAAGIIEKADDMNDPAPLVSPTVTVRKKDPSQVRITVDMRELNRVTLRPQFLAPSPFQTVTQIDKEATVFTVLDGLKGFHQLELDKESRRLTTFTTPLGRFRYRRMPMGWHGSSDVFNARMEETFGKLPRVHRIVEDLLVASRSWEEHLEDVARVLQVATERNVSLNSQKVQFGQGRVKFGGFLVQQGHFRIDEDLVADLANFPVPKTRTQLRSFLGLAQQLSIFTDEVTKLVEPLRALNKDHVEWIWTPEINAAFEQTRKTLASPPYLTFFDPARPTELLSDASRTKGLGFLLRQKCADGCWRTVQCGSRTLAKHEANWSGMAEIEALGVAWAVLKCSFFLDGLPHFVIVTDSNPLVPILNDRRLDQMKNDRLLKLKTALARYSFTARFQSGAKHVVADAFSRAPVHQPKDEDMLLTEADDADREFVVAAAAAALADDSGTIELNNLGSPGEAPAADRDELLNWVRQAGQRDHAYCEVTRAIREGWPDKLGDETAALGPFYKHRADLFVQDELVLYGGRLLIPVELRRDMLRRLHAGHQGINRTTERANRSVWWPGIQHDIQGVVETCQSCRERLPSNAHEPLLRGPEATRPYERIHIDLFQARGRSYLAAVDEMTGWPSLVDMGKDTTSANVVRALRDLFTHHCAPVVLKPDGGTQLTSAKVQQFLQRWGVKLEPSSPHLPRTNGRAESAVKSLKKLVLGCMKEGQTTPDPDRLAQGVIALRNSPKYGGRSPAELLLGENVRDCIPVHRSSYDSRWRKAFRLLDDTALTRKEQWKQRYDERAKQLGDLKVGDWVWVQHHQDKRWTRPGRVVEILPKREYWIRLASGRMIKRSRVLLKKRSFWPGTGPPDPQILPTPPPGPGEGGRLPEPLATRAPTPSAPPTPPPEETLRRSKRVAVAKEKVAKPRYDPTLWDTSTVGPSGPRSTHKGGGKGSKAPGGDGGKGERQAK